MPIPQVVHLCDGSVLLVSKEKALAYQEWKRTPRSIGEMVAWGMYLSQLEMEMPTGNGLNRR